MSKESMFSTSPTGKEYILGNKPKNDNMVIQRITCFKVPNDADVQPILDQYKVLAAENQKDGKPYILDIQAYKTQPDQRNQGYAIVAWTKFKDLEDMKYYDSECEAHKKLKQSTVGKVEVPPLTMFMEA